MKRIIRNKRRDKALPVSAGKVKKTVAGKKDVKESKKQDIKVEYTTFGERLAALRKGKGMTQPDVAKITGYDIRMVSRWELGYNTPSAEAAANLAKAVGSSLDYLVGLDTGTDPELDSLMRQCAKLPKDDLATVKKVLVALTAGMRK